MRRKVALFFGCALVLPLLVAASASGQGAVLQVDDPSPVAGQAIVVTGNFSGTAPSSNVQIRDGSRSGTILATTVVTSGRINATLPAPSTPGWHLLVATQTINANGRHAAFSPGRARIRVRAAGAGAGGGGGGRAGLPDRPLGLLALGSALLLLGAGVTLTARRIRTINRSPLGS